MKILLDTNVWVSALIWGGQMSPFLQLAESGLITLITSEPILAELSQVLQYEKLQAKIRSLRTTPQELMELAQNLSELHPTVEISVPELRDRVIVLATAAAGNVDTIVTGDRDLLVLGEFLGVPIVSPRDFFSRYFNDG
ncbi:MAG: putative toxin-antitoxin system toxin component, PIN family [Synechococcales bacterium]|nr:putative toxin-antitoxin system toxin component, PIN family [Synechococcales bacterium]